MKNLTFAAGVMAVTLATLVSSSAVSAQVRSVTAANKPPTSKSPTADQNSGNTNQNSVNRTDSTRARTTRVSAQGARAVPPTSNIGGGPTLQAHAKSGSNYSVNPSPVRAPSTTTENTSSNVMANRARTVSISPAKPARNNSTALLSNANANAGPTPYTPFAAAASQVYRIGVRDVLDIRLAGHSGKQSTLFTVFEGGLLEFPLAGGPIAAAGLTTSEVAALLRQRIRILDNPAVVVNVRDYASHAVTITGLVAAPGVKNLRREAVPLYTMLAEAAMLPEAARASITRQAHAPILVDLMDSNLASTLVLPGDTIKVLGLPTGQTEFFFIGGEISSPGQKPYHAGVTLTQAILASGGTTKNAGSKVRVSRQGADGRLLTEEYNLRKIQDGKNPDPVLQKGDRIQVREDR